MSSDDVAIRIAHLSKCFHIYDTPRDRLKQFVMPRLYRVIGRPVKQYFREFWSLTDISIEVKKGEIVGIIGRNGAGKSTLLQVICGTLSPTRGDVICNGRIAALLELGSGFNPEFTGRENVYLNGAILGLTEYEINERFDEIAEFADIGEFIEQPVKIYSSGMFVRLAFAVQACVNPEILVIDEALAVGDISFQYKCYKRMEKLRNNGTTILMVTHSTGSVLEYANRCLIIDKGRIINDSTDVLSSVLSYEKNMKLICESDSQHEQEKVKELSQDFELTLQDLLYKQKAEQNSKLGERRFGSARSIIEKVKIYSATDKQRQYSSVFRSGDDVIVRLEILSVEKIKNVVLGISISMSQGVDIWGDNNLYAGTPIDLYPGKIKIECGFKLYLNSGDYLLHTAIACFNGEIREELDQRRPVDKIHVWSTRQQVGVLFSPMTVTFV